MKSKRFFQFNKMFTYIGELDRTELYFKINEVLKDLPIYLAKINSDVSEYEYDNNNIISININYYLAKGVISEDDSIKLFKDTYDKLLEVINKELKNQKLIFAID